MESRTVAPRWGWLGPGAEGVPCEMEVCFVVGEGSGADRRSLRGGTPEGVFDEGVCHMDLLPPNLRHTAQSAVPASPSTTTIPVPPPPTTTMFTTPKVLLRST